MKILVTGYQGYIGPILVPMLEARGHQVVGMDTGFFVDTMQQPLPPTIDECRADMRQVSVEQLQGIDGIAHLAALSNDPMGKLDPSLTDAINHRASVNLATLARQAGVKRFVFASSCSLYGAADVSNPLDETASFNPVSAYAHSKVDTEYGVSKLADEIFTPVFLRNSTAYGLSPTNMRFDLVANNLTAWALSTGVIKLESDGTPWRPLVHVEDISRAFIAALEAPREAVFNQAFNVGRNSENFQVRQIAEIVGQAVPDCSVEMPPVAGLDTRSYRVDFTKITHNLPGFKAEWTVEKGVKQIVAYYKPKQLTQEQFFSRQYIRLKQLQHLLGNQQLDDQLYWK